MLRLFAGSGSQEIQLLQPSALPAVWSRTRDKVARLLRQRGQTRAADLFLSLPFELWDGTNGFNDEFVLLYAELPMQKYVEIADLEDDPNQRALFRQIEAALGETDTHVRFIAAALGEGVEPTFVAAPVPSISSDVLEQALVDVERSLAEGRPATGIDRIHTAFHTYLRNLAREAALGLQDAGMPELFKALRQSHPALQPTGPRAADLTRILNAMATVIDALNPLRNKASLAHPAEELLPDTEAMLVINAVRTLLHYLEKRVRGVGGHGRKRSPTNKDAGDGK